MYRFLWTSLLGLAVAAGGVGCGGGNGSDAKPLVEAGADGAAGDDVGPLADASLDHAEDASEDAKPHDAASEEPVEAGPFVTAPHPPWPQLAPNGGVVLKTMKLVMVVTAGDPQATSYFGFADALVASPWWQSFAGDYGIGTPSASVHVTGPAITSDPNSAAMEAYIASAVASTPAAAADGQTMYMLLLPTGIDILDDSTGKPNTNCQYYGGYHDSYDKSGDAWGVAQHCPLTDTGLTDLEWMTIAASHEISEAASDPIPGNGYEIVNSHDTQAPWTQSPWVAALYGEIGDMCVETQTTEGSYTYQRIWSNTAAAKELDPCVPPYTQYAYVNSSVTSGWYVVTPGASVNIPVTGWSDRATGDWIVDPEVWTSSITTTPGFGTTLSSPTVYSTDIGDYPTTNNGKTSTLTITAPATAKSGDWVTVGIFSIPLVYSGDPYHLWFVGAYIP